MVLGFISLRYLVDHYERVCPVVADEKTGTIFQLNEYGDIVYLTRREHQRVLIIKYYATCSGIGMAVSIIVIGKRSQREIFRSRTKDKA